MTTQEALRRSEKSQYLKVWQVDNSSFYVESEDGKIAYRCTIADEGDFCSCGDFAQRSKNDPSFKCKHLLAVMNSVPRNQVLEAQILEKRKPKLDERFIKQIEDKDFAVYAGLLDLAHQKNLCMVDVEILQYPSDENKNTAICKARVETIDGKKFSDIGDANPENCNTKVRKHLIRMASTRAKARAFRDMDNIGITALEELGDLNDILGDDVSDKSTKKGKDNVRQFAKQVNATFGKDDGDGQKAATPQDKPAKDNVVSLPEQKQPEETKPAQVKAPVKSGKGNGNGNGGDNGNGTSKKTEAPLISEAQKSAVYNVSRRRGISLEDVESRSMEKYGVPIEQLSFDNAREFIRYIQTAS